MNLHGYEPRMAGVAVPTGIEDLDELEAPWGFEDVTDDKIAEYRAAGGNDPAKIQEMEKDRGRLPARSGGSNPLDVIGHILDPVGIFAKGGPKLDIGTILDPIGAFSTNRGIGAAVGAVPILGDIHRAITGAADSLVGGTTPGGLLGQALGQAMGAGPASTPIGSLLGAGLGSAAPGTGPLPGLLGQVAQSLFGLPAMPPSGAPSVRATDPMAVNQLQTHIERAGRAVVARVTGANGPQLAAIRNMLQNRMNQVQATSEHRNLMSEQSWRRQVLAHLSALRYGGRTGTGATGTSGRRY